MMKKKQTQNIPYEEIYSKYPPKGDPSEKYIHEMRGYLTQRDLHDLVDSLSWVTLEGTFREFNKTKNPLLLLNALIISHECGIYPPVWIMHEIVKRFNQKYDDPEKTSLDKLFGVASVHRGKESLFKERARKHIHGLIMHDIFRLTLFGYTVPAAAEAVENKIRKEGHPKVGDMQIVGFEASTLARMYSQTWSKIFNNESTKPIDIEQLKKNKLKFLSKFPELQKPTKKSLV